MQRTYSRNRNNKFNLRNLECACLCVSNQTVKRDNNKIMFFAFNSVCFRETRQKRILRRMGRHQVKCKCIDIKMCSVRMRFVRFYPLPLAQTMLRMHCLRLSLRASWAFPCSCSAFSAAQSLSPKKRFLSFHFPRKSAFRWIFILMMEKNVAAKGRGHENALSQRKQPNNAPHSSDRLSSDTKSVKFYPLEI